MIISPSVATVIQGRWGVIEIEFTDFWKSSSVLWTPSVTDHKFTLPWWSPEARYLLGAKARVLIWALWPTKECLSCIVFLSQILISLSQDAVASTPSFSGEKRTYETQSVCWTPWLSSIVYLQSPFTFHSLMALSLEPETICLLSGEKATVMTSFSCPMKVAMEVLF